MGEVTFKGVFFEENCPKASIHCGNCPRVFLEGNFLRKQLHKGKAIFFVSNHPGGNHSGYLLEGELLVGITFLGDNFPGDDHQGANCLGTSSPDGNETVINTVGQNIFFVI